MMVKRIILFLLMVVLLAIGVSAFEFNGTIYDPNGVTLNNTLINITAYTFGGDDFTVNDSNSSTSNATGWFNFTFSGDSDFFYGVEIIHTNASNGQVEYVGQSLPQFPHSEFSTLSNIKFYLKEAGTINISVINATNEKIAFSYFLKDTTLGYTVSSSFNASKEGKLVYVPREKNYSIMIFPASGDNNNFFVGATFNWNNFSATADYNISGISDYNVTTRILRKQFNSTESMAWVSGYINDSAFTGWDEFVIVPYMLEPGNMLFTANGILPFNTSSWRAGNFKTDNYSFSSGFYNITLPYVAEETTNYLLYAAARNGSNYRGSYLNLTVNHGNHTNINFSLYGLLGDPANISIAAPGNGVGWNASTKKIKFNFYNSSGSVMTGFTAHTETTVDYSSYGAVEFTFMEDLSRGNARISLPLLNVTGFKKMVIYTMDSAPKKIKRSITQLLNNQTNITITAFSPGEIPGEADIASSGINISLYRSNSTCDVPKPNNVCKVNSAAGNGFNLLSTVVGGGQISFRMSYNNITVHYKNVDLLASGPPDALFDASGNQSDSGAGLDAAWRFGSAGPEIYDEVLIGIPYSAGDVDESAPISVLLSNLYDEEWNVIWNTSANQNAENITNIADGDYSTYNQRWLNSTLNGMNCSTTDSTVSCYVNTTSNMMWLTIPHFSGIGPTVKTTTVGNVTLNTTTDTIECRVNCSFNINLTNGNFTLSDVHLVNISINHTVLDGNVTGLDIFKLNHSTNTWVVNGTNATKANHYNFSLYNATTKSVHMYRFHVNKSTNDSAQINITYVVNNSVNMTLTLNLTCTPSWSYSAWTTCSGGLQTRTTWDVNNCGTSVSEPILAQDCTVASTSSSGGGGGAAAPAATSVAEPAEEKKTDESAGKKKTESKKEESSKAEEAQKAAAAALAAKQAAEKSKKGKALSGKAWSDVGEVLLDLSWLWIAVVILAIVVGIGVYVYKKRRS